MIRGGRPGPHQGEFMTTAVASGRFEQSVARTAVAADTTAAILAAIAALGGGDQINEGEQCLCDHAHGSP